MISRNDPCPCGSGKRYKACCGQLSAAGNAPNSALPQSLIDQLTTFAQAARFSELEQAVAPLLQTHRYSGWLWQMYGLALAGQGKSAIEALEQAVQLSPEDARVHVNLGNALGRAARHAEAVQRFACAVRLDSTLTEAHINLAHAYVELERFDEAVTSYQRALQLKPDDTALRRDLASALLGMGNAMRARGRLEEAVATYQHALTLVPDDAAAHSNLGLGWRLLGRGIEAAAACQRALEIDPRLTAARIVLSDLAADRGDFAGAEQRLREAISVEAGSPEAWAALAYLKRMSTQDAQWLQRAQAIAESGLPPRQESVLRFALGKACDDIGQYEEAARHYQRANALSRSLIAPYDRTGLERTVGDIMRRFDRNVLESSRVTATVGDRTCFVVGMLRSGTTLAEQMLAAHPAVFGAGEMSFWNDVAVKGAIDPMPTTAQRYLQLLETLAPSALRVIDKMPGNFMHLGMIHAALPGARVIHMTRDQQDNALSIYFQRLEGFHAYACDLDDIAHFRGQYQRLMAHWQQVLPARVMLEVPYEGLVDDPEGWTRRMLAFLELDWDPRCLEFERHAGTVLTASNWQVRQKLHRRSVGRWRHYAQFIETR